MDQAIYDSVVDALDDRLICVTMAVEKKKKIWKETFDLYDQNYNAKTICYSLQCEKVFENRKKGIRDALLQGRDMIASNEPFTVTSEYHSKIIDLPERMRLACFQPKCSPACLQTKNLK